jgi:hypothetical protein
MARINTALAILAVLAIATWPLGTKAGEPLVVKTAEGKFLPAAASQWAPAGPGAFRVLLKTGAKAADVAAQLKDRIAPIQVEAADELTLVFRAEGLGEQVLLEKLAGLELVDSRAMGDALAALSDLDSAGAPSMGDLSSAGSIRASKAIELPKPAADRKVDPANLVGELIGFEPCQPMPILHLKVVQAPSQGEHKAAFRAGQKIAVRGYYAFKHGTKQIDPADPRTQINLASAKLELGTRIFGKPFQKDGDEWVLETVERF